MMSGYGSYYQKQGWIEKWLCGLLSMEYDGMGQATFWQAISFACHLINFPSVDFQK